ncbi:MAG: GlcNAc-transferase family protein [Rickettsiales bacterium]|nr:GlcNAc-transferase family protein [Rickettsiales bacterium]
MAQPRKRIFVQIASYRDPECQPTIDDLFAKAEHPARVFVGVCLQTDPKYDADCQLVPHPNVRVTAYDVQESQGAGWARNQAQKLWAGEEYTLQIQAHMRFESGWDTLFIDELEKLPSKKPALTAWLPSYVPPDRLEPLEDKLPIAAVARLGGGEDAQMIHMARRLVPASEAKGKIIPTPLWVGNFLFARSELFSEIAFDPHIYFWGEEINYSVRLYTHGWDLFHLNQLVAYHCWIRKDARDAALYRDQQHQKNRLALERNLQLLGLKQATRKEALDEIERYGLGSARTLQDYWAFAAIDFPGWWGYIQSDQPSIFVAIASYRDPELRHTIADLFDKAQSPHRLRVGVCLQVGESDEACMLPQDWDGRVRIQQVDYAKSKGAGWARSQAHALRQGEAFVLQIDSHMRFEAGWDAMLIDMLERAPSPKAVISGYASNYEPPNERYTHPGQVLRICVRGFAEEKHPQLLHMTGDFIAEQDPQAGGLYPSPFCIQNFLFARGSFFDEVPIDPHFAFYGDEISHGARLWTHGYDVFQPDHPVLYHYWIRGDQLHLHEYRDAHNKENNRSYQRIRHLLGFETTSNRDALKEIKKYGLGDVRALKDWWEFAGVDWTRKQIQETSKQGRWNLQHLRSSLPRIFVQIASYRDPECQWTVKDLFEKASHPERITIGICWQFIRSEDQHCFLEPYAYPDQVRVAEYDAKDSNGVCWARSITQSLWHGEEFTLQIDSHMRFEEGWDDRLISMWHECQNPKAVITSYPPGYTPPDDREPGRIYGISAKEFDTGGIFLMQGNPVYPLDALPSKPMRGAFISANLLFGPASIIADVPYDPYLYFFGEEISMAVRLWTQGYDLYHPNMPLAYHYWKRSQRVTHFDDHADWEALNARAYLRVKHLLGTQKTTDKAALAELSAYGLGTARSLADYQAYAGIDFAKQQISDKAYQGDFQTVAASKSSSGVPTGERIFVQIASYRDLECQWTVKDLFEKAEHPERISVGICWQFDEKEDADCFQVTTRPEQVRIIPVDWREANGVCWARHQTQQLWDGEEYTLQIDSHMRFVPGWDRLMIEELKACPSEKPVISSSPAPYIPPNNLFPNPLPSIRRVLPFQPDGNIRGRGEMLERIPEMPLNGAFIAAGYVFSRSDIIKEVPYDPYLYFDQEEITYAARIYTHGWDIFSARQQFIYHYYNDDNKSVRPLHWNDLKQTDIPKIRHLRERGLKRFNHLTGHTLSQDPDVLQEIERYGFGKARSLAQYEEYCGIDFKRKVASEKALRCFFIRNLHRYLTRPIGEAVSSSSSAAAATNYTVGDFIPFFEMPGTNGKLNGIETRGGKSSLLLVASFAKPNALKEALQALQSLAEEAESIPITIVVDGTVNQLMLLREKLPNKPILLSDPERRLPRMLGLSENVDLTGYALDRNMRILCQASGDSVSASVKTIVTEAQKANRQPLAVQDTPKTYALSTPALIVPDVFTPEFCARCIEVFKTGYVFDGTVGAEDKLSYVPQAKVRSDHIIHGEFLGEIDRILKRRLFPEIEKIFGFKVTHREPYKIGLYEGEKQGVFKPHRDNFMPALGYRRVAVTIQLNDEYEGGGLRFPEYGDDVYRPAKGSAIAFSCNMLHEALPVIKGGRFIMVGFFHGEEDERYRQQYQIEKGEEPHPEMFALQLGDVPELPQSRQFYYQSKPPISTGSSMQQAPATSAITLGKHIANKTYESSQAIIIDNFLPEDEYQKLHDYAVRTDYEYVNMEGKVNRAWHLQDRSPLRSSYNMFYTAQGLPNKHPNQSYPSNTPLDAFVRQLLAVQPHVGHFVGQESKDWDHVTVTSWLYPPGTSLSMHNDGSGVYTGAYVYYLNQSWRMHWGGLLLLLDEGGNRKIFQHRLQQDEQEFYQRKWLNANDTDDLAMEEGIARCITPKKNRIVFIANSAYHMVTRVNESAGDEVRMSLAGFYNRKS